MAEVEQRFRVNSDDKRGTRRKAPNVRTQHPILSDRVFEKEYTSHGIITSERRFTLPRLPPASAAVVAANMITSSHVGDRDRARVHSLPPPTDLMLPPLWQYPLLCAIAAQIEWGMRDEERRE